MADERLIVFLEGLSRSDFARILSRLPEVGNHIPQHTSHFQQVDSLIGQICSTGGSGMDRLIHVVEELFPDKGPFRAEEQGGRNGSKPDRVVRNNLPHPISRFIGREEETVEVCSKLHGTRLLTLTGTGGSGKTRLALQVAKEMLELYSDGVCFVDLAPLSDPARVPQTVAKALGIKEQTRRTVQKSLIDFLASRNLLILMDNCEHLVQSCADIIAMVLLSCPNVSVLATSREVLGIPGEQVYRLPSMLVPTKTEIAGATPDSLQKYDGVLLFTDRAINADPNFDLTAQNASTVADLCYQLDGIPLAIELAAARVPSLSVQDINQRLANRFRLLTRGNRTALPRQQTLKATIDWSYDLLNEKEKILLNRLAVFAGGWTLEAAETVCGHDRIKAREILDLLTSLVDKSLISVQKGEETTRYRMLETLRCYATEKLDDTGKMTVVQGWHRDWFVEFADKIERYSRGVERDTYINVFQEEHDNLRTALELCVNEGSRLVVKFAGALWRYWLLCDSILEGNYYIGIAVNKALVLLCGNNILIDSDIAEVSRVLDGASILARRKYELQYAEKLSKENLDFSRKYEFRRGIADALLTLGNIAHDAGEVGKAKSYYHESLQELEKIQDLRGYAVVLGNLGNIAKDQGDYEKAYKLQEESYRIRLEQNDPREIAISLGNFGGLYQAQGNLTEATKYFTDCIKIRRRLNDKHGMVMALSGLANFSREKGEFDNATSFWLQILAIGDEINDRKSVAFAENGMGDIAYEKGDFQLAKSHYINSLTEFVGLEDEKYIPSLLSNLGDVSRLLGEYDEAIKRLGESYDRFDKLGYKKEMALSSGNMGDVYMEMGLTENAYTCYQKSAKIYFDLKDELGIADSLERLSSFALSERISIILLGAVQTIREKNPRFISERVKATYAMKVAQCGATLEREEFTAAWEQGRALTWEQAVAYALGEITLDKLV